MVRTRQKIVVHYPDWAFPYIDSLKRRAKAGEKIDIAAAEKLIQAFMTVERYG